MRRSSRKRHVERTKDDDEAEADQAASAAPSVPAAVRSISAHLLAGGPPVEDPYVGPLNPLPESPPTVEVTENEKLPPPPPSKKRKTMKISPVVKPPNAVRYKEFDFLNVHQQQEKDFFTSPVAEKAAEKLQGEAVSYSQSNVCSFFKLLLNAPGLNLN